MSKPDKHPGPWAWSHGLLAFELVDSDGRHPLGFEGEDINELEPVVMELIRLAPELEAVLRSVEWNATPLNTAVVSRNCCPSCDANRANGHGHNAGCRIAAALAILDAARNETGTRRAR